MTQEQYKWLQDNGYDPTVYDVDQEGNIFSSPIEQAPQKEVMSMPRAFGTSFLGNLIPSAAALAGGAAGLKGGTALGAPFGPVGMGVGGFLGGVGGSLAAGYGVGKGQQAVLENYAPEAVAEMQRAETDQPVASYLGGFAPNALTMRPSVKGLSGLLRPTVRNEETLRAALTNPNFLNPAINVGANVAGSTAGQLVNMSEGGEFSVPRFGADVLLGSLFNKPTGLGKRMGFSDIPENVQEAPGDLAKSRDRAEFMANVPKEFVTPRAERGAEDIAKPGVNIGLEAPDRYFTAEGKPLTEKAYAADYSKWWKSEAESTTEFLQSKADEVKVQIPKERLKELSNDPEVGEVLRDPSKMEAFVAKQADQTLEDVFQMMERHKTKQFATAEEAANQTAFQEKRAERGVPNESPLSDVNAAYEASKKTATEAAREIYTRLQRPEGEQSNKITQEDINLATELANRRGLKVQLDRAFAGSQEVRGMYLVDKNTGDRIIRINPLMATADTAIHEIGHDIFKGVTNKGMRRSLMDTALDSPAYKAELAARAEEVRAGKITEQAARDIALEEGLIQAFGEKMPQVNRGELRAWFAAFKASMKQLVTGKMSPEDALAWMHYATTENVPWKGVAVAKGGQERLQRGEKPPVDEQAVNQMIGESVSDNIKPLVEAINLKYEDIINSTGMMPEMKSTLGYYIQQIVQENPSAFDSLPFKVGDKTLSGRNAYYQTSITEPMLESLLTGKPIELSEQASNNYKAMVQGVVNTMQELKVDKNKVDNIKQLLNVLADRNIKYDSKVEQLNNAVKRWSDPEYRKLEQRRYESSNNKSAVQELMQLEELLSRSSPSDNPDIRYQRPIVGKAADAVKAGVDKTLAEIDQITRRGGIYETVGRSLTRAYNTETSMLGKARSLALKIINLDYSDANKLRSHLYNEYRNQQLITPAPEIAEAYKEWRTQAKAFWVAEANKVGHQIDTGKKGLRNRIESEFWFPGHDLSDEVHDILASKVGTPEYQKLKNDYLRDAEADYLSQGKLMTEAKEKALVDFEEQRALVSKTFDPSAPANFAGARKPMGRPLPESWVEKDFRKTLESYNKRSAKDYASQEHFEKSPEVMAALGSKKFFNGQPIPASVLQNTPVIAPDPSIQSVMREFSGQPLQMPGKTIRSFGAMASSLALQTISRIGDVGGTVTKPLAYIGLGDYGAYMGGMAEKLSDWSKLKARSIESGLNNPNANKDFHQVIGMGQDAGKYMQKVLDSIGFITGSSKLESVARTLAQAQGEMIVSINKRKAATGDKDAVRFLDTLNNDWRTQSDMALAAQFGQMMQGTYDMRQLPAWFLEGGAAPYLTWSKWSMSQMNNFRKFAVEPAMQGNFKPLIAQVLVGMAGGGAIEQVQEWLSGKESKSVKWSELESWARQNEGTIGTDGGELLLQKFMIMAQKTGTFGFAGDLAMMPINALVGDTQSSVGVFPAAELFADGMKNVAGALTAIDKGEDVGLVLQRFGKNVLVGKTQMARVASTWIDEVFNEGSDNLRSADRRKARLFEELSGTGRSNGMFPVSYENLAEQQFERSSVSEDTGEEAFSLVKDARESATSPEDYASRIRKLKTSQNAIMPSLDRQPMKAARYLGFVEGAEPGKGSETMKRYLIRQNEGKYRKSLIESFSGIR